VSPGPAKIIYIESSLQTVKNIYYVLRLPYASIAIEQRYIDSRTFFKEIEINEKKAFIAHFVPDFTAKCL
jgi:hypothetical protein